MRTFQLVRDEDVSGVSGTGAVAEVAQFESGKVAVAWFPNTAGVASVGLYDSLAAVEQIHGHEGRTRLVETL